MEPIVSNFGYLPLDIDFLEFIRNITEELGIVLIFDEIQSFRVSEGGAQESFGITPDMTTLGKIIEEDSLWELLEVKMRSWNFLIPQVIIMTLLMLEHSMVTL